jgi:hypothetical protein
MAALMEGGALLEPRASMSALGSNWTKVCLFCERGRACKARAEPHREETAQLSAELTLKKNVHAALAAGRWTKVQWARGALMSIMQAHHLNE